jgi:hypothetical protein
VQYAIFLVGTLWALHNLLHTLASWHLEDASPLLIAPVPCWRNLEVRKTYRMMKSEPKNSVQNVLNFQQTECQEQNDSYRYLISSNSTQFSTHPLSQTFWLILQIFHVLLLLWYLAAFTLHHALWHSDRFLCSNRHYGLLFVSNQSHCGVSHLLFPM